MVEQKSYFKIFLLLLNILAVNISLASNDSGKIPDDLGEKEPILSLTIFGEDRESEIADRNLSTASSIVQLKDTDKQDTAKKLWAYILRNIFPQYSDENIDTMTAHIINDDGETLGYKLRNLIDLYDATKERNSWTASFYFLICSLKNVHMVETLVSHCPLDVISSTFSRKITGFELAGLSCRSKPVEQRKSICQWRDQPDILDCWYDTDAPDAICSARQKGQICPLTLKHVFSDKGVHVRPRILKIEIDRESSLVQNLNKPFNPNKFGEGPFPPISIGTIMDEDLFSKWGPFPQSQNMPIKMPFTDYRLPLELSQFEEAVQKLLTIGILLIQKQIITSAI